MYNPMQTLLYVVLTFVWSLVGYICLDGIEYGTGGLIFWVGITLSVMALTAIATVLVYQINTEMQVY